MNIDRSWKILTFCNAGQLRKAVAQASQWSRLNAEDHDPNLWRQKLQLQKERLSLPACKKFILSDYKE